MEIRKNRSLLPHWLSHYSRRWLKNDIVAGSVTAAVVIPKALAYATIAGLPIQVGLYTVFLPMILYALTGSSRPLSVSTTTTLAILTATQLDKVLAVNNNTTIMTICITLTLLVGIVHLLASFLHLGFIADFISEPVLVGFKAGIGLVIILDQIPKLLSIHFDKGSFWHNLLAIFHHLPETSLPTLLVGIIMIALLVALEHFMPKVPAPLVVVAMGVLAMGLFHLLNYGIDPVGTIPLGLPSFFKPDFSLFDELWFGAVGIALMSFTETIAAGRAFVKSGEPPIRANQELFASGLANIGGAFFGAMPSGGGTSQTAVNRSAGAQTQLAAIITAALAVLTMLLIAPLLGMMPQATLAAIVIVYSIGLIRPADFNAIRKVRRTEFIWALVALIGVVLLGTLKGIVVAIIISLAALAQQVTNPPIRVLARKRGTNFYRPLSDDHPDDETFPGLLILRPEGRIFFLNASRIGEKIRLMLEKHKPSVLMLDFSTVIDLEYTALKMLVEADKRLGQEGVAVWLVGLNPEVLEVINRSNLGKTLGPERMHYSIDMAVKKYQERINI
ncbi:SulP family inorganic anion transporter [Solitalea sp. MAHUQ-68]|uniref:SulP family inorganic anion transporter n=1 Tax=Solitalea agri TaxID=2953739 RepID=A0A9X2FA00_9SPHI|nr:SulP family inorganic anion transporter [Solitalea agri]MCO4294618.1 SulP family inorganic anion transporter [Solitalea agri]